MFLLQITIRIKCRLIGIIYNKILFFSKLSFADESLELQAPANNAVTNELADICRVNETRATHARRPKFKGLVLDFA